MGSKNARSTAGVGAIKQDVALLDPEICSLATLAACFANIQRGISKTAQTAQTLRQNASWCADETALTGGLESVSLEAAMAPVLDLGELEAQLRQTHILRFDYFWEQLQAIANGNFTTALRAMRSPSSADANILASLCALSDYYAAVLRGLGPAAREKSGLLSDEEACQVLSTVLLNGSTTVQMSGGYPTVEDAVLWERWDAEPVSAFKWFKLYLRMQEKFGFRDFIQFQSYLQFGTAGVVEHTAKAFATPADAICSLGVEGSESGAAEHLSEELGMSSTALAKGILNPSSIANKQELLRIRAYFHLFYWDLRCTQYDKWERALLQRRGERRAAFLLDEQYATFERVFGLIKTRVMESAGLLSPNDAIRALQDIAKMMRLTTGYHADKPLHGESGAFSGRNGLGATAISTNGTFVGVGEAGNSGVDEFGNPIGSDDGGLGARPQLVINFVKPPNAIDACTE